MLINILDKNECQSSNGGCHANATCTNLVGSYKCTCKTGFTGNGNNCTGESFLTNDGSDAGLHFWTFGFDSFNYTMQMVFISFLLSIDINECNTNHGGCHANATCTNLVASHKCTCNSGFDGNETNCVGKYYF